MSHPDLQPHIASGEILKPQFYATRVEPAEVLQDIALYGKTPGSEPLLKDASGRVGTTAIRNMYLSWDMYTTLGDVARTSEDLAEFKRFVGKMTHAQTVKSMYPWVYKASDKVRRQSTPKNSIHPQSYFESHLVGIGEDFAVNHPESARETGEYIAGRLKGLATYNAIDSHFTATHRRAGRITDASFDPRQKDDEDFKSKLNFFESLAAELTHKGSRPSHQKPKNGRTLSSNNDLNTEKSEIKAGIPESLGKFHEVLRVIRLANEQKSEADYAGIILKATIPTPTQLPSTAQVIFHANKITLAINKSRGMRDKLEDLNPKRTEDLLKAYDRLFFVALTGTKISPKNRQILDQQIHEVRLTAANELVDTRIEDISALDAKIRYPQIKPEALKEFMAQVKTVESEHEAHELYLQIAAGRSATVSS